jgi:hypothetical protein
MQLLLTSIKTTVKNVRLNLAFLSSTFLQPYKGQKFYLNFSYSVG